MKVTIGGDRLGSGGNQKQELKNYERSTHNLSQKWKSSMTCGALYPFLVIPAMKNDVFEIDLDAAARTIPTKGPLFASFKLQVDVFQCPIRLYQGILHNNPVDIGLKMSKVKFPVIETRTYFNANEEKNKIGAFNNSCLLKYLGISGIGRPTSTATGGYIQRRFNAIPMLAYYDIFKTYYANKQETNAYVITGEPADEEVQVTSYDFQMNGNWIPIYAPSVPIPITSQMSGAFNLKFNGEPTKTGIEDADFFVFHNRTQDTEEMHLLTDFDDIQININGSDVGVYIPNFSEQVANVLSDFQAGDDLWATISFGAQAANKYNTLVIKPFSLKNIDDMREALLSYNSLNNVFEITGFSEDNGIWGRDSGQDSTGLPYFANCDFVNSEAVDEDPTATGGTTINKLPLNGIVLKTYQSDIFNNWVKTDWITGDNGIAEITAVATTGGEFTIDSLNLAEKLYNLLNRIAVSGNTYQDWETAVYGEGKHRHIESPIYCGGMSSEVVFEEIIQSAPADGEPLGTLGGRGTLLGKKGGNITIKCDEASFIIGIASLTPRVDYTQGNEFYMTDLMTMDDFHKPALDGIGFQNLIGERMAFFDTAIINNSQAVSTRSIVGKVPAWLEYMTAIDKAFGDFAELDGKGFMVLNRNYEVADNGTIKDATTYVDPKKYNYAFAYTELDAQNFWVQINSKVIARRKMSAKQIPNI